MANKNSEINEDTPHFFFIADEYIIGTKKGIASSGNNFDISAANLAVDSQLLMKLHLESLYARNLRHFGQRKVIDFFNFYLSSFTTNVSKRECKREYLDKNGILRILIRDPNLKKDLSYYLSNRKS
jgi:hypothetical protein